MDVGEALLQILVAKGVKTVYGIPGDYALGLFDRFEKCPDIELVCPGGEEGAAFAADAQAQLGSGFGVCLVTYGVGALRILNAVGGAYASKSRVLVISAAPGMQEREQHPRYLHHVHRTVDTQLRIFREVCTEVGEITTGLTAVSTIHKVLDAMTAQSLPGFLQVPRDQVAVPLPLLPKMSNPRKRFHEELQIVDTRHRTLALQVLEWLRSRSKPMVVVGMEIQRFGLQELLQQVLEREGWRWAESLSGKNILPENSKFVGLYAGCVSLPPAREAVESSDGVLMIGLPLSDLDAGMYTMNIETEKLIEVSIDQGLRRQNGDLCRDLNCIELLKIWSEQGGRAKALPVGMPNLIPKEASTDDTVMEEPPKRRRTDVDWLVEAIKGTHFDQQRKENVIKELLTVWSFSEEANSPTFATTNTKKDRDEEMIDPVSFAPGVGLPVTVQTLTQAMEATIEKHPNAVVLAETGDPMFTAAAMRLPKVNQFLNNGFWASLGFVMPGAIGAWYASQKQSRPIVLIGDGAFLTSCNELATLVRYRIPAIVVIFDNRGYGTLRPMLDGPFNDVQPVDHVALAKGYGCDWARRVWSEKEVWESLECIFSHTLADRPMVLSVMLDSKDASIPMNNLVWEMKKRVQQPQPTCKN